MKTYYRASFAYLYLNILTEVTWLVHFSTLGAHTTLTRSYNEAHLTLPGYMGLNQY